MRTGGVFLNYRHEDTAGYAGRFYDLLKTRFPGRVFLDFGEIAPGSDFVAAIENAVGQSAVLLALIGRNWLTGGRLQNPTDFVRLEIASALKRNVAVIPVLVGGASLPDVAELPDDLSALARRQALALSDADWEGGTELLVRALERYLGRARRGSPGKRWAAGVAVLPVAIGVALMIFHQQRDPDPPGGADPKFKEAARKNVAAEVKGLDAITTALDGVTQKIQSAGQPSPAPGGLVTVSAVVKDKSTGKPLSSARVLKVNGAIETMLGATDDSGRLALSVPAGEKLSLTVDKPGYQEPIVTIDPSKSRSVVIGLDLK